MNRYFRSLEGFPLNYLLNNKFFTHFGNHQPIIRSFASIVRDLPIEFDPRSKKSNGEIVDEFFAKVKSANDDYVKEESFASILSKLLLDCKSKRLKKSIRNKQGSLDRGQETNLKELTKTVKLTKEDYSRLSMFFQLMGLVDVEIKPNNISSNPPKTTENFRKYRSSWTNNEDDLLRQGVRNFGVGNWVMISKLIGTKTNCHARRRWNVISAEKHGKWSKDEVDLLHHMVEKEGRKWSMISKLLKRTEGSVINRYVYDLKSARINRSWNEREKENFHKAYKSLGKDWVQISYAVGSKTPKQCSKYFFQNYQVKPKNEI